MLIGDALKWGQNKFLVAGIENAQMEASWLLSCMGLIEYPNNLWLKKEESLSEGSWQKYQDQVCQRLKGAPLSYILGSQEFMGLNFKVNRDVLIPRQETEIMVEEILKRVPLLPKNPAILDIGTGSGNIAISLAKNIRECKIVATDISSKALSIAKKNSRVHQVNKKITFLKYDLFTRMNHGENLPSRAFDLIVSNPPYIKTSELDSLQKEIHFEPKRALDGGSDGLRVIEPLINRAKSFLRRGGFLLIEVGYDQSKNVSKLMKESGFRECKIVKDYSGIERVVIGKV